MFDLTRRRFIAGLTAGLALLISPFRRHRPAGELIWIGRGDETITLDSRYAYSAMVVHALDGDMVAIYRQCDQPPDARWRA